MKSIKKKIEGRIARSLQINYPQEMYGRGVRDVRYPISDQYRNKFMLTVYRKAFNEIAKIAFGPPSSRSNNEIMDICRIFMQRIDDELKIQDNIYP